jgi:hypothetical protein
MARFSVGVKTTAGSTTLPIISLYNSASVVGKLREVGAFNTTNTAVDLKLTTMTTQGTPGTGLTEANYDSGSAAAACTAFTTHTVGPTLGVDLGYRASLGAAVGAGVIWTFGDTGIRVAAGTANGIGVIVENGTGQACQAYLVWDE